MVAQMSDALLFSVGPFTACASVPHCSDCVVGLFIPGFLAALICANEASILAISAIPKSVENVED